MEKKGKVRQARAAETRKRIVAWCMTDASVVGSDKTDAFCENIMFPALTPYRQKEV